MSYETSRDVERLVNYFEENSSEISELNLSRPGDLVSLGNRVQRVINEEGLFEHDPEGVRAGYRAVKNLARSL